MQECDGVRIISQGFHDLIHKVDTSVQEIYRIASMSPGSIVLMASQAFSAKSHKADEYIRMISETLPGSVPVYLCCWFSVPALAPEGVDESCKVWSDFPARLQQRQFLPAVLHLEAAELHEALQGGDAPHHLPAHQPVQASDDGQANSQAPVPLALDISEFLKLSPAEERSRVLAHWAIYKVVTSPSEEAGDTARQVSTRLGLTSDISYSDIAECGKKHLAFQLLEHEVRADQQVPLLLKLGQGAPALRKAIYSGDTDLIYHVILALQEQHSISDFHMIMRQDPVGSKLYTLHCKQRSVVGLVDWLQQEDDYGSMARSSSRGAGRTSIRVLQRRLTSFSSTRQGWKRSLGSHS